MPHGWLILDKPLGLGSTQAVSAVKRALRAGGYSKVKVGHGGTLDPLATGVLPVALGEATKLAGRMLDSDKEYVFTIRFGAETDTLDAEGQVVRKAALPRAGDVRAAVRAHRGPLDQIPPAYSALKVDGQRAYDRARAGEDVVLPTRAVVIRTLVSTDTLNDLPNDQPVDQAAFRTLVSKGTYIRSLARDIAQHAGSVGHVATLRRIKAGPFDLSRAITLDKLAELGQGRRLAEAMLPLEAALDGIPALALDPAEATHLKQGRVLCRAVVDGFYLARLGTVPIALVEARTGQVRVERGFNLDTAKDEF